MSWRDRPEAGTMLGIRFLEWAAYKVGRKFLWFLLYPTALYFLIVRTNERRSSKAFLLRVLQRRVTLRHTYLHFLTFARVTADRLYFMQGNSEGIVVRYRGLAELRKIVGNVNGGIFLAAHFGSFEAARLLGSRFPQVDMRVVFDTKTNPNIMQTMSRLNPDFAKSIIDPNNGEVSLGLEIAETLKSGLWVGLLADRIFGSERTISGMFLGDEVEIPAGPFIIAAMLSVPLVAIFPVLEGDEYEVVCEVLGVQSKLKRGERDQQLANMAQAYLDRLEIYVRKSPYNWFNFYDYWKVSKV